MHLQSNKLSSWHIINQHCAFCLMNDFELFSLNFSDLTSLLVSAVDAGLGERWERWRGQCGWVSLSVLVSRSHHGSHHHTPTTVTKVQWNQWQASLFKPTFCFSSQADAKTLFKRSSPDVITGRGFAAPPKLNIETYNSPGSQGPSYYSDNLTGGQYDYYSEERAREPYLPPTEYPQNYQYEDISGHYQRPQTYQSSSYLPSSDYDRLKDKLYTNDQLRSYIKDLKQQLHNYENIVPHNHERGTKIDLSRYNHNQPYTKRYQKKWLVFLYQRQLFRKQKSRTWDWEMVKE